MREELASIYFKNTSNRKLEAYPITLGVPLIEGALKDPIGLAIEMPDGSLRPVQVQPLETWPDDSIKWMLLDYAQGLAANESGSVKLVRAPNAKASPTLRIEDDAEGLTVTTQHLAVRFSRRQFALFQSYRVKGQEMVAPGSDIVIDDLNGKSFYAALSRKIDLTVLVQGEQRVVVEVSGRTTAEDDTELFDFRVRYTFLAGDPGVELAYKFTNREAPETGVKVASIRVVLPTLLGDRTTKHIRQSAHGAEWFSRPVEIRENVELMSGKAVVDPAKSNYGQATVGKIIIRNLGSLNENLADYPYFLRPGNPRTDSSGGLRQVYPYVAATGQDRTVLGWFYEMELHYPKGLRFERGVMTWDIWPEWAGDCQIRRGQSKEHLFQVVFADRILTQPELEGIYFDHEIVGLGVHGAGVRPVQVWLSADHARACKILQLHRWLRYDLGRYFPIEVKMGTAGAKGGVSNKGMLDIGDYVSPERSWCHNNENDGVLDMIREFFRREEPTMLPAALIKARHAAHVDFIATDPDPLRQGTTPAHCPEHTDGATYPSHMWLDGLLAAYGLSGEPDFREAALAIGENMLRWQKLRPIIFYADSRESGWPMLAFLRLYEFTRDRKWLDACQEIFENYRSTMNENGEILHELPHGVGTLRMGYGEFIAWRAMFFYHELTGRTDVKDFLVTALKKVYRFQPGCLIGGWGSNDLFPSWALFQLTGEAKYLEDNYPFLQFLMSREGNFPWSGNDMHFYLGELDRRGVLERFCRVVQADPK